MTNCCDILVPSFRGRRLSIDGQTPLLGGPPGGPRTPGFKRARRSDLLYRIGSGGPEFYGSMDYAAPPRCALSFYELAGVSGRLRDQCVSLKVE